MAACDRPGHEGHTSRKRGLLTTRGGKRQRWECVSPTGESHYFSTDAATASRPKVRCPNPKHADAQVRSRGTRERDGQRWRRYSCVRPSGEAHWFQVLEETSRAGATSIHFPPACPEHAGSTVRMFGTYGKGPKQRQRYQCVPADGSKRHTFTPPLSRESVEFGVEDCATCEELLSPHRGLLTGARHTPWTLTMFAQALNDLSVGSSYAAVSVAMRERRGAVHSHFAQAHAPLDAGPFLGDGGGTHNARMGKASWHLAADLVEQYAPLIYAHAMAPVHRREAEQRAVNDAQLGRRPGAPLAKPLTYILDELPVFLKVDRKRVVAWSVLAVVEVLWHVGPTPADAPTRENRLRLVRAYPSGDANAWRLVLGELERPDFIVADAGSGIDAAVTAAYDGAVPIVPSLYHVHRNLRQSIVSLAGTTHTVEGRAVPLPQVAKHLDLLTREGLLNLGRAEWGRWWNDVIGAVATLGAPVEKLLVQRKVYEELVWRGLQVLVEHPHLPASNAAIENRLRATLSPFLENRKQLFRNIARTNCLFDLAVARAQGAFHDLDALTRLLREDNEKHGGWAPTPRAVADPQPPHIGPPGQAPTGRRQIYSSLRNRALVPALLAQRTTARGAQP